MNRGLEVIGWTLVHFVWQGAFLAVMTSAALRVLRNRPANVRYLVACVGLAAMLIAPLVTAWVLSSVTPVTPTFLAVSAAGITRAGVDVSATPSWAATVIPIVTIVWLLGVGLMLGRLLRDWWRVRRLTQAARLVSASRWQVVADRLSIRLRVRRAIHVVEMVGLDTPAVLGWLRPVIVLPLSALAGLSPAQVEAILIHELAHIRRHDYLINLLQSLAETVLFFHPAVWWVSGRIRSEREQCCDVIAVQVCGDPLAYAAALAGLEEIRSNGTGLVLAARSDSLLERIRRVLAHDAVSNERQNSWSAILAFTIVAVAFAAVIVGTHQARAYATGVPAQAGPVTSGQLATSFNGLTNPPLAGRTHTRTIPLSVTLGVLRPLLADVTRHWRGPYPGATGANGSDQAVIEFRVRPDGSLTNIGVWHAARLSSCTDGALRAVRDSSPTAPLPQGFSAQSMMMTFSCDGTSRRLADVGAHGAPTVAEERPRHTSSMDAGAGVEAPPEKKTPTAEHVYSSKDAVSLPRVLTAVQPHYTAAAEAEKIQGTVWLSCVVGTNGVPSQILAR